MTTGDQITSHNVRDFVEMIDDGLDLWQVYCMRRVKGLIDRKHLSTNMAEKYM